jgi:parvulin-like peptidyl-prolyl isomerase
MPRVATGACLALLSLLCGPALGQGSYPGDALRINGEEISYQRFAGFYEEYRRSHGIAPAARGDHLNMLMRVREEALDLMIEQELVRQAALEAGVEVGADEVDRQVDALRAVYDDEKDFRYRLEREGYTEAGYREHIEGMLAAQRYLDGIRARAATVTDEELESYYRDNEERLTLPEQVRVRHILLTWKPLGTVDDRAAIREQMAPILERARAGADFAELARTHSDDSATRANGGDTGLFPRGEMTPAFEEVAFALEPGEISEPVETPFGVHILKLEERREARLLPLEEIREQLREHVAAERAERAVRDEIDRLREAAEIEILIPLRRQETRVGG